MSSEKKKTLGEGLTPHRRPRNKVWIKEDGHHLWRKETGRENEKRKDKD